MFCVWGGAHGVCRSTRMEGGAGACEGYHAGANLGGVTGHINCHMRQLRDGQRSGRRKSAAAR